MTDAYRRALLLSLGPAAGIGLGRFAYALLLPAMQQDLGWTYAAAGWMNAANAGGYLAGAIAAPMVTERLGSQRGFVYAMIVLVPALAGAALVTGFLPLALLRILAGLCGGLIYVCGAMLVATVATGPGGGLVLATFYSGAGLGMALSALTVSPLLALMGVGSWPLGWLALALLTALCGAGAFGALRGLEAGTRVGGERGTSLLRFWRIIVGYALFGLGSVGYMTFIYGHLADSPSGWRGAMLFWSALGLTAAMAPWFWRGILARSSAIRGFGLLVTVNALGAALPFLFSGASGLWFSAVLFGGTFFTTVAATTGFVIRLPVTYNRAEAIRAFTVAFGVGQFAGPVVMGWAADITGRLDTTLLAASGVILLGALLGVTQRSGTVG